MLAMGMPKQEYNHARFHTQFPAMPVTPTLSRILAISLTVRVPLLAQKKSSQACEASLWFGNSELFVLHEHDEDISYKSARQRT